jgi:hypothetical protein
MYLVQDVQCDRVADVIHDDSQDGVLLCGVIGACALYHLCCLNCCLCVCVLQAQPITFSLIHVCTDKTVGNDIIINTITIITTTTIIVIIWCLPGRSERSRF